MIQIRERVRRRIVALMDAQRITPSVMAARLGLPLSNISDVAPSGQS